MKLAQTGRSFFVFLAPIVFVGGALSLGDGASAAPPGTDGARSGGDEKTTVRSEAARLVTGSPEHLQSAVAGTPPTAVMKIVPVAAKAGSYPGGTTTVGNELVAFTGGFRAWFEFKLSDWDPNGDDVPPLQTWQIAADKTGYLGANAAPSNPGVNLAPAVVACASHAVCAAAFGEVGAKCDLGAGFCRTAYADGAGTGHADSWCADTGAGSCSFSDCDSTSPMAPRCFGIYASGVPRPDAGIEYYGATLVLDIPPTAQGKYTVNLVADQTFLADTGAPPNDIPTFSETGFVVDVLAPTVQACCLSAGGCTDLDSADCANAGHTPQGAGTDCMTAQCSAPTGACCNHSISSCTDNVIEADCLLPLEWTAGTLCVNLPDPCLVTGACCDSSPGAGGACTNNQFEANCTGANKVWTANTACSQITCLEVVGACCDRSPGAGGLCSDGVLQAQCTGLQQTWSQGAACANILCEEARGSCCNLTSFSCTENVLFADCQGPNDAWRKGATCGGCAPGPQMLVTPVAAKVGSYPPGTTISGQEITLPPGHGGVRIWCELQIRSWDPDGDGNPPLHVWQMAMNDSGMHGVNADPPDPDVDISLPIVPCANNAACASAFGESWANCDLGSGTCKAGYVDRAGTGRPDSWCRDTGSGPCFVADVDMFPPLYQFFGIYAFAAARPDQGLTYYGGTLVLDVPAGATGRYTVPLDVDQTFLADTGAPPNDIPTFSETGFVVSVRPSAIIPDAVGLKTRSLSFAVPGAAAATGTLGQTAIRVTPVDLQNPNPPNAPCCPPPDFSTFEGGTCTAAGEANGCARWVGPPITVLEKQDNPPLGAYVGARLQCDPYYHDWDGEGLIQVVGAELVPSSSYAVHVFAASCKGSEASCLAISSAAAIATRRAGDIAPSFNPPSPTTQPDGFDVTALVDKFKGLPGAASKAVTQLQPNVPDLNADVGALDVLAGVDAFKGAAYAYSGPCVCPSTVTCNADPCSSPATCSGGMCVNACIGGFDAGQPCINNTHCPGGSCGSGFCRDRCGRCKP